MAHLSEWQSLMTFEINVGISMSFSVVVFSCPFSGEDLPDSGVLLVRVWHHGLTARHSDAALPDGHYPHVAVKRMIEEL